MKIEHDLDTCCITITDKERSEWLDGSKAFYDIPKDDRPEWNFYTYFDDGGQAVYKLEELARRYPLNEVPQDIVDVVKTARELSNIYDAYLKHALAVCLKEQPTPNESV